MTDPAQSAKNHNYYEVSKILHSQLDVIRFYIERSFGTSIDDSNHLFPNQFGPPSGTSSVSAFELAPSPSPDASVSEVTPSFLYLSQSDALKSLLIRLVDTFKLFLQATTPKTCPREPPFDFFPALKETSIALSGQLATSPASPNHNIANQKRPRSPAVCGELVKRSPSQASADSLQTFTVTDSSPCTDISARATPSWKDRNYTKKHTSKRPIRPVSSKAVCATVILKPKNGVNTADHPEKLSSKVETHSPVAKKKVAELEREIDLMRRKEMLLLAYPDPYGPCITRPSGDACQDMAMQIAVNKLRIELLTKQTGQLSRTLAQMRHEGPSVCVKTVEISTSRENSEAFLPSMVTHCVASLDCHRMVRNKTVSEPPKSFSSMVGTKINQNHGEITLDQENSADDGVKHPKISSVQQVKSSRPLYGPQRSLLLAPRKENPMKISKSGILRQVSKVNGIPNGRKSINGGLSKQSSDA